MMARQGVSEVASRSWTAVVDELVEHHYGAVLGSDRQDRAA
jgi:hypothetical protein